MFNINVLRHMLAQCFSVIFQMSMEILIYPPNLSHLLLRFLIVKERKFRVFAVLRLMSWSRRDKRVFTGNVLSYNLVWSNDIETCKEKKSSSKNKKKYGKKHQLMGLRPHMQTRIGDLAPYGVLAPRRTSRKRAISITFV